MGRHKKFGEFKCPYISKSGDICGKLGRYNSETTARNMNHRFAKTFKYMQFMHNDGSNKHYIPLNLYTSQKHKGHFFESTLNILTELGNQDERWSRIIKKMAENLIIPYYEKFTEKEKEAVQNFAISQHDLLKNQFKYAKLTKTIHIDYLMKGKTPPDQIVLELDEVIHGFYNATVLQKQALLPIISLYVKYDFPRRKTKWKISYEKQKNWPLGTTHIRKGVMG